MSVSVTCVCCPRGCTVTVDKSGTVSGNGCRNGAAYARQRVGVPAQRVTGEVRIRGAAVDRCPVKTDRPIPPDRLEDVITALRTLEVEAPVYVSQVLLRDVCSTGANVISCGSIAKK